MERLKEQQAEIREKQLKLVRDAAAEDAQRSRSRPRKDNFGIFEDIW